MLDPRRRKKRCLCLRFAMVMFAVLLTVLQLRSDMASVCPILTFLYVSSWKIQGTDHVIIIGNKIYGSLSALNQQEISYRKHNT